MRGARREIFLRNWARQTLRKPKKNNPNTTAETAATNTNATVEAAPNIAPIEETVGPEPMAVDTEMPM